jgi:hypothetical protein
MVDDPKWQLVLVLWGTKYGADEVNHLVAAVRRLAAHPPRIVLLSDRDRPGLDAAVTVRPIPEFFLRPDLCGPGCQAKLAMFEAGAVPADLPAIFVDVDTVVLGDLTRLLDLLRTRDSVVIFQSAVLPIGPIGRLVWRLTGGRKYARGNSSIVVYHPAGSAHVAMRFRDLYETHGLGGFRPLIADERFLSWAAQPHLRAIPRTLAVKLPTEFALPWAWLIHLRGAMPWNRRRWAGLIAVTLPGTDMKGETLVVLPDGARVRDGKGRLLIWSHQALGPVRERIIEYYGALDARKAG